MKFNISAWRAWAPGLSTQEDWLGWLADPQQLSSQDAADVSFLPAMQRRRLSPLARMAFHVAWPLAEQSPKQPVVFCSRHGETPRNLNLLKQMAEQEILSPTHFSLSVHNAIIGLWSIFRQDESEMTAIAATQDGLEHAVIEAQLLLSSGADSVLLIIAEEQQPELYLPWIKDVPFAYALALQLTRGDAWSLSLSLSKEPSTLKKQAWPHALTLLPLLLKQATQVTHSVDTRCWQWQVTL
ncbi:beta-ketoacyl synthase chain length factor [Thiopseudomonas acetoxidans]|uniref:Beta-ketoacyl synthase chain length factor n=1 Tax=Thiopseudomonas acetoxidans TaxID=3041622 RepID=A0ABT7SMY2_9GAMM|nr:beta-ketoacyl synthase chain length factor [Thiopseudomonas sp. CY1220]MDM7857536.1 beta-ketoacyl synthase chain length factor [Thiopseudomonas sp. CY1220]